VRSRPGAGNQPPSRLLLLLLLPCPWEQQNASGSSNLALKQSDPARRHAVRRDLALEFSSSMRQDRSNPAQQAAPR
jgi:hypothetical protein